RNLEQKRTALRVAGDRSGPPALVEHIVPEVFRPESELDLGGGSDTGVCLCDIVPGGQKLRRFLVRRGEDEVVPGGGEEADHEQPGRVVRRAVVERGEHVAVEVRIAQGCSILRHCLAVSRFVNFTLKENVSMAEKRENSVLFSL